MRKLILAGMACAAGIGSVARATPPGGDERLYLPLEGQVSDAKLLATPGNDQLQREYPRAPLQMGLAGDAAVSCTVETDARLDDCRILRESPAGLGFGAAAIRMASYFKVQPATVDSNPVQSRITLPIRFQTRASSQPVDAETIAPPTSPAALVLARQVVALDGDETHLHDGIAETLKQLTAYVVAGGDAAQGERIEDAYRQAADEAISDETDRRARLMAATMTADQLHATLAFLRTPAGAAYREALGRIEDPKRAALWTRIVQGAKAHLCGPSACAGETAAAPKAASRPSPSR